MESLELSDLLNGQEPPMGLVCSGFFVLQFYEHNQITDPANCTYLRLGGAWYRIFFEAGIVFWRQDAEPLHPTNADFQHGMLLNDLSDCDAIVGHALQSVAYHEIEQGVCVNLAFSNQCKIIFEHRLATQSTSIELVS